MLYFYIVGVVVTASTAGIWVPLGAIATLLTVLVTVTIALYQIRKNKAEVERKQEEKIEALKNEQTQKIDSLVLAVVGKPASPDGTFKKVDGLVDNFDHYVKERVIRDAAIDSAIAAVNDRLDAVAKEYVTNGGSTVKDDLVVIRTGLNDLRQSVKNVIASQTTAAQIASDAADVAAAEKELSRN